MTSEDQAAAADEPAPEDKVACALLHEAIEAVMRTCPAVLGVSCALTYSAGKVPETAFRAVWFERSLDPTAASPLAPGGGRIDAVIGGVMSTAHLLKIQAEQAEHIAVQLRELVARLGQEAIDARDRLQSTQEKEGQTADAAPGRADPGPPA